jgi:hypothetical protein
LDHGADVSQAGFVEYALENEGSEKVIYKLIKAGAPISGTYPNASALARKMSINLIQLLIQKGSKIEGKSFLLNLALTQKASAKVIQALVDAGCRVDHIESSLRLAKRNKASAEVIQVLKNAGSKE